MSNMNYSAVPRMALFSATVLVATGLAFAQAPPAQKSVPLPSESSQPAAVSQTIPSTEALAWSQKTLAGWPEATRRLGAQLFTKYGAPAESTARHVTWFNNGPWTSTTLHKDGPQHNFAAPHKDILEQSVRYKVPLDKLAELAKFNRSVIPNLTRGEITSISDSEESNFLALNVADDIFKGDRSAEEARTYYAQIVRAKMIKEPERDLQKLKFTPAKTAAETADPDEVAPLIKHMSGNDGAMAK
jgi:hypothetical protein